MKLILKTTMVLFVVKQQRTYQFIKRNKKLTFNNTWHCVENQNIQGKRLKTPLRELKRKSYL